MSQLFKNRCTHGRHHADYPRLSFLCLRESLLCFFFLRTQGTSTTTGEQGDITTVVGTNDCLFCYSFNFLFPFSYLNLFEVDKQTWSLSPVVLAVQLTHGCKHKFQLDQSEGSPSLHIYSN